MHATALILKDVWYLEYCDMRFLLSTCWVAMFVFCHHIFYQRPERQNSLQIVCNFSLFCTCRHWRKCALTYAWLRCLGIPWKNDPVSATGFAVAGWPFSGGSFLTNCGMKTPPTFQFLTACLSLTTLPYSKPFTSFVLHSLCHGGLQSLSVFFPFI